MAGQDHYITQLARSLQKTASENAQAVAAELAPPKETNDSEVIQRAKFIALSRDESYRDPLFLQRKQDDFAPAVTMPDGTKLRTEAGLKAFHAFVKEIRPDIYAAAMAQTAGG